MSNCTCATCLLVKAARNGADSAPEVIQRALREVAEPAAILAAAHKLRYRLIEPDGSDDEVMALRACLAAARDLDAALNELAEVGRASLAARAAVRS